MSSLQSNINGSARPGSQAGFSLVEVLVALLVLSIGLLGLAALQTYGLAYSHQSYERTQATFLIDDIIDHMRANSQAAVNYATGVTFTGSTAPLATGCQVGTGIINCPTPTDMANFDIDQWIQFLQHTLSSGAIAITSPANNTYQVKVTWSEKGLPMQQSETLQLF